MKSKKSLVLIGVAVLIAVAAIVAIFLVTNNGHRVIMVESFSGNVALERDNSPKDIFKNMNLKTEDIITTGADGLIGLLVDDDKTIAAVENTCFAIVSKGSEKNGVMKIELKYGTSLIEIKNKLSDGSFFEVETPNASLSVRGTAFEVTYSPETQTTILKVTQGSVQANTKAENDIVDAGEIAIIKDTNIEVSEFSEENKDNNNDSNNAPTDHLGYVDNEEWAEILKGGSDYNQLLYLLKVVSRCNYAGEEDYLKNALYWLCDKEFSEKPLEPIETLEDGSVVYDVSALNRMFSFITKDTISEENLNSNINRLNGNWLICTKSEESNNKIGSTGIYYSYYSEPNKIIVDYLFNVVDIETFEVEQFPKKAHLILDETGKYVLDYIE